MTKPTLNIIGCGKLAQTLAKLWTTSSTIKLQSVLNQTPASAQRAVEFIGVGQPIATLAAMRPADLYLIATVDDQITASCEALAASGKLNQNSIVFHCSGALSSDVLASAKQQGAATASIHPIRSFANPQQVVENFNDTWCGSEGDDDALAVLIPAFNSIGAQCIAITRENKTLYH
ncbi:MAG: DUF2520 domain-containing protein, partial [Glaciimonas sp.]|nr:DUF2520 domain-containing protein [Glaciimonas sp.]